MEDAGTRFVEAKKMELDQFAGRHRDDITAEFIQQTRAATAELNQHTGNHFKTCVATILEYQQTRF